MLTVMRDMAASTASQLAHMPQTRLEPGADAAAQNALIADVLERALVAGEESVNRGPQLLAVLAEAGVVDAGGYAVTVLVAGVDRGAARDARRRRSPINARRRAPRSPSTRPRPTATASTSPSRGHELDAGDVRRRARGGRRQRARRRRRDDAAGPRPRRRPRASRPSCSPGAATCRGSRSPTCTSRSPARSAQPRLGAAATGGRRPAPLRGARRLRRRRRRSAVCAARRAAARRRADAQPVDRGAAGRRSTRLGASDVVVLPNSPNVVMAAEHARRSWRRPTVVVVPTRSPQAGLAAAVAIGVDADADAVSVAAAMADALEHVRTGGVAPAARARSGRPVRHRRRGRLRRGGARRVGRPDGDVA